MKEAAENEIIVKGGKFLEEASIADTVVFDKTGTLTSATPQLSRIITFDGYTENEALSLAACLEEHYAHPIATAIVHAVSECWLLHPEEHAKVEYIVAHGVATKLHDKKLSTGSRHFVFDDEKVSEPANLGSIQNEAIENGESLLYLAKEKKLIGIFAINDPVRKKLSCNHQKTSLKRCQKLCNDYR